jgi:hypothetical protein
VAESVATGGPCRLAAFIDADDRAEIIVGGPLTSIDGSVIAGQVYSKAPI